MGEVVWMEDYREKHKLLKLLREQKKEHEMEEKVLFLKQPEAEGHAGQDL